MSYKEQLELMSNLIKIGFGREYIIWTLYYCCSEGLDIGSSMMKAIHETLAATEFPRE